MTPGQIAIRALITGFIISFAVITGFAYTTLLERKVLARMQARVGPNRAGYILSLIHISEPTRPY